MSDQLQEQPTERQASSAYRLLVICNQHFNKRELWPLLGILLRGGIEVEVVSTSLLIRDEVSLRANRLKRTVDNVAIDEVTNFHGVVFVSGDTRESEAYWNNKKAQALLVEFRRLDKVIAGICCAAAIIAPVCVGIKISTFPLVRNKQRLRYYGVIPSPTSITVDRKTITAENQAMTEMWSEEILNALIHPEAPPLYEFVDSGFIPKGKERAMPEVVRLMIDEARQTLQEQQQQQQASDDPKIT